MKFKVVEVVRGFQNMTYNIDGKDVFTKCIFIDAAMNEDIGGKGFKTVPKTCVSADVIRAVEHNPFPCECELEMEELATKNKSELFVRAIKPLKVLGAPNGAGVGKPA